MRSLCAGAALLALVASGAARAAECPGNPNALGTSRVLVVDPAEHARLGTMQYTETLPLEDHEVVLTFDDGPLPPYTNRALDIMAGECVKATYFLVGRRARAYPEIVRQIQAAGHTIGTHSQNHPFTFHRMSAAQAEREVEGGIESVKAALGDAEIAPFFRIPGLLRGETVEKYLASRALMTWSADFPADDWKHIKAAEIVHRAISRIEAKGRGVLLLHDIQPATVLALPALLKELKSRGYRIVHVEAAAADRPKTATLPAQWVMKWSKRVKQHWPGPRLSIETLLAESSLPVADPESFGIGHPFGPKTTIALSPGPHRGAPGMKAAWPQAAGDDARVTEA
ncbi:MAG: polysaccharide deacetylase family protein, partial [Bradyrhizobium sp.]